MSRTARLILFLAGGAALVVLLAWAVGDLPSFGHYNHAYGLSLARREPSERHAANVITAIVFDYRGFDTMGEELILFAAVLGTALLLREAREEEASGIRDRMESDAVRAVGLVAVAAIVLLSLQVISHGTTTPGGGFQGGVVGAAGLILVYLAGDWVAMRRAGPKPFVDAAEAGGAAGFVAVGLAMLIAGGAFLENLLPYGRFGLLDAGGEIPIVNLFVGIEVSAAFVLLFMEFLEELMYERKQAGAKL